MNTKSAKAKGRRAQQEVVALLREHFGWAEDDCRPAVMGEAGDDVKLSMPCRRELAATLGLVNPADISIEVKNVERLNIWESLRQAMARGRHPLLFFRRNRTEMYVAMRAEDFVRGLGR